MADVQATVTGIQNVAVSSTAPTDGQVLTYVSANSNWAPSSGPSLSTLE